MNTKLCSLGLFRLLVILGLAHLFLAIACNFSSVEAQSNKGVRSAIDRLRQTLISTNEALKDSNNLSTNDLKSALQGSLNQLDTALAQITTTLDAIQDQQTRKIDNNQLYCIIDFGSISIDPVIQTCYFLKNPHNRISTTLPAIQEDGWHLTALSGQTAVFSKYIE